MPTNASPAKVTFYGRTLVNLIGIDGNFKKPFVANTTVANGWHNGIASSLRGSITSLEPVSKYGGYSQRFTTTVNDTSNKRFLEYPTQAYAGKYYLYLVDATTDGVGLANIGLINQAIPSDLVFPTASSANKTHYAKYYATATISFGLRIICQSPQGAVTWVQFDGARLYEIDAATYAKIDVDPEYTGEKLAEKFPYVNSVKHTQGIAIKNVSRNLLPPFTQWGLSSYIQPQITDQYTLTAYAGATNAVAANYYLPALPNTQYTVSGLVAPVASPLTFNAYVDCLVYSGDNGTGTLLLDTSGFGSGTQGSHTFTTPANAKSIVVRAFLNSAAQKDIMFSFQNLQLEYGSVATPFVPYNEDWTYLSTTLASSVDGTVKDMAYEREGRWYKFKKWNTGIVLDGSYAWLWFENLSGFRRVKPPLTNINIKTLKQMTKYNGAIMNNIGNDVALSTADQFVMYAGDSSMAISVSEVEAGWASSYTPSSADLKNYFNGWKLNSGSLGTAYSTGTKYWTPLVTPKANFDGKIPGSTVENPHSAYVSGNTSLMGIASGTEQDINGYGRLSLLDGSSQSASTSTVGGIAQFRFKFDLIEHVLRKHGVAVFGSAVTVADRVTWLKSNIGRLTCNWYGYGIGPNGNKATLSGWRVAASSWDQFNITNVNNTVAKYNATTSANGTINGLIDTNGFVHFIAYTDASNGTTTSVIYTDYAELEIELNMTSIPSTGYSSVEYTPYIFDTTLINPYEELISDSEGMINLQAGNNQLELLEGVIFKEKATPLYDAANAVYNINAGYTSTVKSRLKNKAAFIVKVYKNGEIFDAYTVNPGGYGNDATRIRILESNFDTTAEYYVTYIMLDKYAYTNNAIEARVEYQTTSKSVIGELTQQEVDNRTNINNVIRSTAELYKKIKALGG